MAAVGASKSPAHSARPRMWWCSAPSGPAHGNCSHACAGYPRSMYERVPVECMASGGGGGALMPACWHTVSCRGCPCASGPGTRADLPAWSYASPRTPGSTTPSVRRRMRQPNRAQVVPGLAARRIMQSTSASGRIRSVRRFRILVACCTRLTVFLAMCTETFDALLRR